MDHPAQLPGIGSWRSAAFVAGAVAGVELVLLLVVGIVVLFKPFAGEVEKAAAVSVAEAKAPPAPEPAPAAAPNTKAASGGKAAPAAKLPREETSVLVLNGNGRSGAATAAAGVVRGLDYVLAGAGNAPRSDFTRSVVMYRPGFKGEAARLAGDVRVKRVSPLDGLKPAELQGAHVVLIVGGS